MKTISVIIPAFNEEARIGIAVGQFAPYLRTGAIAEVIVSDNGSADGTRKVAEKAGARVVGVTAAERAELEQSHQVPSIGACRNTGAAEATGDLLLFIDADVLLDHPEAWIIHAFLAFEKNTRLVGAVPRLAVYASEQRFQDRFWFGVMNVLSVLQNNILGSGAAAGDCMLVRRSAFETVGGFNTTLKTSEDQELFHRLLQHGATRLVWVLRMEQSSRRIRKIGWPRILGQWGKNWFVDVVLKKKRDEEHDWEPIR